MVCVACFPRERHLMKFSWQIFPTTDVQTEEGCYNTQLYFSSPNLPLNRTLVYVKTRG